MLFQILFPEKCSLFLFLRFCLGTVAQCLELVKKNYMYITMCLSLHCLLLYLMGIVFCCCF